MANLVFMGKTGLIGGEATKLDSIDGATLTDNDAAFVNVSNVQYIYRLDADSGAAESSPDIISPDANAGDKRWILQGVYAASLSFTGLTASLPVFTDGTKKLVSNTMTGTGKVVMDTSPTLVTPTIGAASGTSLTLSGLTASLPVFSDGSKNLVSNTMTGTGKVVMDTSPTIAGHATIEGITLTGATGTGKLVFDTSPTLVTPVLGAASGTSLTLSGLTASLPVFSDGSKKLISKSVADTLTALGVGSAAFSAYVTSTQPNVTGDSTSYLVTGAFWTELFDTGDCFSNGTFTAPATGIYLLTGSIALSGIASGHVFCVCQFNGTFGRGYIWKGNPYACAIGTGELSVNGSIICPMNSGNTAYLNVQIGNAAKEISISGGGIFTTLFSGYRLK